MLKISYAGCLGLSPVIFTQFTIKIKSTKTHFLRFKVIQDHWRWYTW